jgi:hypothetical protein
MDFNALDITQVFSIKLAISVFMAVAVLALIKIKERPFLYEKPNFTIFCVMLCTRFLPFWLIYIFFNLDTRSDVNMFYDTAVAAKAMGFVYRDFESAYSPLFAYLTALPLIFWNSAKAIVLQMILVECLTAYLTYRYFADKKALFLLILYFLLPAPFVFSVLGGQEDIWMWLFVLLTFFVGDKPHRHIYYGLILGLGLLTTKALLVLYIPAVLVFVKKPMQVLLGLLIIGIPSLVFMYYHSELLFLSPIQQANNPRTPNIWTVMHPLSAGFLPLGPPYLNWVGLLLVQFFGIFTAYKLKNRVLEVSFFRFIFVAISLVVMIVQQSSLANYSFIFMLPLLYFLQLEKSNALLKILLIFNVFLVIQPALWWGLGMPIFHIMADLDSILKKLEFFSEIVIVICLILFLVKITKQEFSQTNKI